VIPSGLSLVGASSSYRQTQPSSRRCIERTSRRDRFPLAYVLLLGLVIGVGVSVAAPSLPHLLIGALAIVLTLPLALEYVRRGSIDWFSPINTFIVLFAPFWLLRSLSLYVNNYNSLLGIIDRDVFICGLFWAIVGLVAFYAGYFLYLPKKGAKFLSGVFSALVGTRRVWNRTRMKTSIVLLTGLILASYLSFIRQKGGLLYFITHWGSERFGAGSGVSYLMYIIDMLQPATWLLFVYYRCRAISPRVLFWGYSISASLLLLSLGGRVAVIILWIGLLIVENYTVRRISTRNLLILFVIAVLLTIGFRWLRSNVKRGQISLSTDLTGGGAVLLAEFTADFTAVDLSYFYFSSVPTRLDFLHGASIIHVPIFVVPRIIWKEKPVHLGPGLALEALLPGLAKSHTHIAPSIIGDLYLNFSYIGIVIGMFIIGMFFRVLNFYLYKGSRGDPFERSLVYCICFVIAFWLMKGGMFAAITRTLISCLLPLVILIKLSKA
jgi:oligosaccharide repeat unit polymerase